MFLIIKSETSETTGIDKNQAQLLNITFLENSNFQSQ